MKNNIFVEKLHLHMFKGHPDMELEFDEITQIYGRNASGKTSIADAFAYAMTGLNFWGNKFVDPINTGTLMWVETAITNNSKSICFKRMLEENGGKLKTILTEDVGIDDKDVFLSLVNPRYFVSLSPADAKKVLLKIANLDTGCIPICFPGEASFSEEMQTAFGDKDESLSVRWNAVEEVKKALNGQIKKLEETKAEIRGKIDAYEQTSKFFTDNGKTIPNDLEELFDTQTLQLQQKLVEADNDKDTLKKQVKKIDSYKILLTKMAVKCIEDELNDVTINLDDNGKDVFVVTYKNRDYKSLSNSEQLCAGLEIANAISAISCESYPCFIDNAEALQVQDLDLYPSIEQFIILSVADVDLSIYKEGTLTNPVTKETMIRTKESLTPNVVIIGGWD